LKGKNQITVQILMQAVVTPSGIFEQERGWMLLSRCMAVFEPRGKARRKKGVSAEQTRPTVRYLCEAGIKAVPEGLNNFRQRVREVLVLTAAEIVPCHVDSFAESRVIGIKGRERRAFVAVEKRPGSGKPLVIELRREPILTDCRNAFG